MASHDDVLYVAWKGGYVRSGSGCLTVGRDPSCDVIFSEDPGVSRRHARFLLLPSAVKLEDLGSRNGTFVEGHLLTGAALLSGGEWVRVGNTELRAFRNERSFRQAVASPTLAQTIPPEPDGNNSTITTNVFASLLRDVARVALSRPEEIPGLIADAIDVADRLAESGHLTDGDAAVVADFAIREALSQRDGEWLRRVLRIYATARRPMPADLVDRVVAGRSQIDAFPEEAVGAYIAVLASLSQLSPLDRQQVAETVHALTEDLT